VLPSRVKLGKSWQIAANEKAASPTCRIILHWTLSTLSRFHLLLQAFDEK
jgi:hypothetical protein